MPIYAYKCSDCGHAQDVLQKMSDPLLTVCPECGKSTYVKQVTAAGFQLKGTGWYVTDFRNNGAAPTGKAAPSTEHAATHPTGSGSGAASPAPAAPAAPAGASSSAASSAASGNAAT